MHVFYIMQRLFKVIHHRLARNFGLSVLSVSVLISILASPVEAVATYCKLSTPIHQTVIDSNAVISGNGNAILFESGVDISGYGSAPQYFVYSRNNKTIRQASLSYKGESLVNDDSYSTRPAISDNGRLVVFFSDAVGMVP
jgi:hypothetical protein